MKRISILLVALLALGVAACSGGEPSASTDGASTAPSVPEATSTPTATPQPSAVASAGPGVTGALMDALPDEVAGMPRTAIPGLEQFLRPMLESQAGVNAEEAEFALATYGEGEVSVTAMRLPGLQQAQLEMLARIMSSQSGAATQGPDVDTETVTVGGKEVLRVTSAETPDQTVFIYIASDAFFSVITSSEDLAAELLSQLP